MARREWSLQDAKARFSAVVEAAQRGEPQFVTKRGRPAVVVVSASEFATLRKRKRGPEKTFVDHLLAMPKDDGAFPRMRLRPRKVRF